MALNPRIMLNLPLGLLEPTAPPDPPQTNDLSQYHTRNGPSSRSKVETKRLKSLNSDLDPLQFPANIGKKSSTQFMALPVMVSNNSSDTLQNQHISLAKKGLQTIQQIQRRTAQRRNLLNHVKTPEFKG